MGLMNITHIAPKIIRSSLGRVNRMVRSIPYRGTGRDCPLCGKTSSRFAPHGTSMRDEARCVHCGSLERHRLIWLYFEQRTDLFDGRDKSMLHVAPEPIFDALLSKRLGKSHVTADLFNPNAMVKMDITDIQYPDDAFDVIYCSHVLEHVPDDMRAMREFHRVLKPSGWAILLVPIQAGAVTEEDLSITDPQERARRYGQADHVRQYGEDYVDRLRAAGFTVEVTAPEDLYSHAERVRLGLRGSPIYHCRKS